MIRNTIVRLILSPCRRYASDRSSRALVYEKHGAPMDVLKLKEVPLPKPKNGDIVVKFMAAPVNPADVNMIEGVYAIKPVFPAIGGNEGVAQVIESHSNRFKEGDWVVPNEASLGTWRTTAIFQEDQAYAVPSDMSVVSAATLSVNPCTAYRMLTDFVKLYPGEWIIQNGATSGVGQAVIQIAKHMNLRTINIIRRNRNVEETVQNLTDLGADVVVIEDEFDATMLERQGEFEKPRLALNCVGGKSSLLLLKYMVQNGVMVTYGGMSKRPSPVPAGALIFKNISYVGFWMTRWTSLHKDSEERTKMWTEICKLAKDEKLLPPNHTLVSLQDYKDALYAPLNKQIFLMD